MDSSSGNNLEMLFSYNNERSKDNNWDTHRPGCRQLTFEQSTATNYQMRMKQQVRLTAAKV